MNRTHAPTATILLAALSALAATTPAAAPPLVERLRWNARERTAAGVAELRHNRPEQAADAFDAALRARPDDPLVRFNAGTGRLAAGRADAVPELEQAARDAPDDLAPDAWFNLGNARLAAKDAAGAVEAFEEALRRQPENAGAKRNLELARRALSEQQKQPEDRSQAGEQQRGEPNPGDGSERQPGAGEESQGAPEGADGPDRANRSPQDERASDGDTGSDGGANPGDTRNRAEEPGDANRAGAPNRSGDAGPLPHFHDVPELDAEQAAALLQAVENLERDERRRRAHERALAAGEADEDW